MPDQRDDDFSPDLAPTLDLDGARDSFDEILAKVVRGGSARAGTDNHELAIGTELLGRFLITRVLGAGGMGTVYVAKDATLGREVAIKVHHTGGGGVRLRREAMAMAKLAHPNVVTVFEVGELEGRPFVVMEYVAGTTLRDWLRAQPRTPVEIIEMWLAAGAGLAAAHTTGLIHRDIKPENVLIGDDGRARVGDFGLARELDSQEEAPSPPVAPSASQSLLSSPMTQTGAVLGTPAYMAPEQFTGAVTDARADQFAFCVALWEALWGERPFAGGTFAELHASITSGVHKVPPPGPRVPAGVRIALERGLAPDRDDRYPTMQALLDALRTALPKPKKKRWVAIAAGGAIVVAGLVAWMVIGGSVSCDDAGAAELALVPLDLPQKLRAIGATDDAVRIETGLGAYAKSFRASAKTACSLGRARHDWSPELVAQSDACFAVTARQAAMTLAELAPPIDASRALYLVTRLPAPQRCASPTALVTGRKLPADPTARAALIDARALVLASIGETHAGNLRDNLAALEQSSARNDPEISAGVTLIRGEIACDSGHIIEGEQLLADGYYAARAIDHDELTTHALVSLIASVSVLRKDQAATETWKRTALADADRLESRAPALAGRLHLSAARAFDAAEDAPGALRELAKARQLLPANDPNLREADLVEGGLMIWTGKVDDGIARYERAIAQHVTELGPDHPLVASALSDYAASLLSADRREQALGIAKRAAQILARNPASQDRILDAVRANLGATLIEADQDEQAKPLLEQARADYLKGVGARSSAVANVDENLALIYLDEGQVDRALEMLEQALSIVEALGPGRIDSADIYFNIAAAKSKKKDAPGALAAAKKCAAIYDAKSPGTERNRSALVMLATTANDVGDFQAALAPTERALSFHPPGEDPDGQNPAWARLERARALIGLRRWEEARPLIATARAAYAKLEMGDRVAQLDAMAKQLK